MREVEVDFCGSFDARDLLHLSTKLLLRQLGGTHPDAVEWTLILPHRVGTKAHGPHSHLQISADQLNTRNSIQQLANFIQQRGGFFGFSRRDGVVLGHRLLRRILNRKSWEHHLVDWHIEPFGPPTLGRVDCLQAKVMRIASHLDLKSTHRARAFTPAIVAHLEDMLPQCPAGGHSQETLAKHHETGDMHNAVGSKIMNL